MFDKNRWYSVQEIHELKLLPMATTPYKIKMLIKRKLLKGNILGRGEGLRYYVKGSWLIEFLAKWEAGDWNKV